MLCIENHGLFAGRSDQVLEIINEIGSPALKSTFDTGNFVLVGQNPENAVEELKGYIDHVHVKDFLQSDVKNKRVIRILLYQVRVSWENPRGR